MIVSVWSDSVDEDGEVFCIVCKESVPLTTTTVGLGDAGASSVFACNEHLTKGQSVRFLRAYVDFWIDEKLPPAGRDGLKG